MTEQLTESRFRLIRCDTDGAPEQPVGDLPEPMREHLGATAALYRAIGYRPPWVGYLAASGDRPVGLGAFVGPPADGEVEIAYYTAPEAEGRGFAAETARHLIAIARAADPHLAIVAKTLPAANASATILRRLGFRLVGVATDDEIGEAWAWRLDPATPALGRDSAG